MLQEGRTISFEFFPPRNADDIPGVLDTVNELTAYCPDFISVTYGAGGSTVTSQSRLRLKPRSRRASR